jgi:predicted transport protein
MPIFFVRDDKLSKLSPKAVDKEKDLQGLIERNLFEALGLHFLATEYPTTFGGRIDTLAVDTNGAPVIIEYKRGRNDNVINQGLSYLKWLKSQKKEFFEKLMTDKLGAQIASTVELDWSNPRVICIAESYSKFDIDTVEVIPLRIELMRYRFYEEGVLALDPVNVPEAQTKSVEIPLPAAEPDSETDLQSHIAKGSDEIREIFEALRERIMALDESVIEKPTKMYVAYRVTNNFAEVMVAKSQLKIHLRPLEYDDPKGLVERIPDSYNWTLSRRVYLRTMADLDYVLGLIEQSYKDVI